MKISEILDNISQSEWFDMYHLHPSLFRHKRRDLNWMAEILNKIFEKLKNKNFEYQAWIMIDLKNSDYDAIFIHSNNPNQKNFPIDHKPGKITRNKENYLQIISKFKEVGLNAYKLKGYTAIIAESAQQSHRRGK